MRSVLSGRPSLLHLHPQHSLNHLLLQTVQGLQRLSTQLLEFRASGANTVGSECAHILLFLGDHNMCLLLSCTCCITSCGQMSRGWSTHTLGRLVTLFAVCLCTHTVSPVCCDIQGDVKRAVEFLGMSSSIDEWNADILTAITSTGHPFTIIDAKAVSDTARRLILRDCVHFKPRVYEALALIDLAVLFLELDVCPQQAQPR